jgi:DNA-binding transcriptional LysR family regulator
MELDQIRTLVAVTRRGSFTRAAQDLYLTQPAVSIRIKELEQELGHQLLVRRQRGVELTPAGRILHRRCETILGEIASLRSELTDLSDLKTGRVSLGASDTVCLYLLPRVLHRFAAKHAGIELSLSTQISRRVLDLVVRDEVDVGIVTLPVENKLVETQRLYDDEFLLIFPPGHVLDRRRRLVPGDLHGHPIIHLKPETYTRAWIDSRLEKLGLKGQVRLEVSTVEVIKRLVEAGLGISLVPQVAVLDEARAGRLRARRVPGLDLTRPLGLAFRRGKYFSRALHALVDEIRLGVEDLHRSLAE